MVRDLTGDQVFVCTRDEQDRRQTRVALSPHVARQAFEELGSRPVDAAVGVAAPHLPPQEVAGVIALLDELTTLLDAPGSS